MTTAYSNLLVVGDRECGKTHLLYAFTKPETISEYVPITFENCFKDIKVDGDIVELCLRDNSGAMKYDSLRIQDYSGTDVILLCFSVESHDSLEDIPRKWLPELHHFCPKVPILLVATKKDLRTDPGYADQKLVSSEEGRTMAAKIEAWSYFECSAMKLVGVRNIFENATRAALGLQKKLEYPYDCQINMSSLSGLAGTEIVASLAEVHAKIMLAAGISLSNQQKRKLLAKRETQKNECLEIVIGQWGIGNSNCPPTWRSLLDILKQLNLQNLCQKIEDLLDKSGYLSAYREVLATHECIEMWFIKVILVGAPRLGKTTARRRLTGEISDISSSGEEEQASTGAVESGRSIVIRNLSKNTALVTPTEWEAITDLADEARTLLQFFYSHTESKKKNMQTSRKPKHELSSSEVKRSKSPTVFFKKALGIKKKTVQSLPGFDFSSENISTEHQATSASVVAEMFRKAVGPEHWKDIKHLFKDTVFVKMEDTGGQPEFMDMLPALTIGPALYLLFCKLIDDLKSTYTVSYLSPSGEPTTSEESTYTMEDILLTTLASVSCFKSYSSTPEVSTATSSNIDDLLTACKSSLAYIVGTHKDKVSEEQIDEFDKKLQATIRSTDFFKEGLVKFSSDSRMVLPIDNMSGGDAEIKKIQKFLGEGMKKHFKKLSIPAAWLVLSLCLRKREERIASLRSVLTLAKELKIPEREAKTALWFLHHNAGVLMYFPKLKELKDTVICDTQIVYDSATNLIVNTFKFDRVDKAASEKFRETGQFSLEDIKKATAEVSGDFIPLQKLVKLLEHLNIIAPITPSSSDATSSELIYFMPCVLQNATNEELDKWWASANATNPLSPSPLFIRYKCGYVPIGVFPAMIASLAGKDSVHMVYEGIKKNRVMFRFGAEYDKVTLIYKPKYYAIHITRQPNPKTSMHAVCRAVRTLVESALNTVVSRMNYSFIMEYQLSFECPPHPGREHLCVVDNKNASPRFMCCLGNSKDQRPVEMTNQHLVWFKEVGCCTTISEQDFSKASGILQSYASKWREIGQGLGFKCNELDNIQSRPLLLASAPHSFLSAMLQEWQQWAPEDARGSTGYATLDSLRKAVSNAGLGLTANEL